MTGRARGRARGRGRANPNAPGAPPQAAAVATDHQVGGRGRSRGAGSAPPQAVQPAVARPQPPAAQQQPPTQQIGAMSVRDQPDQQQQQQRRRTFDVPNTKVFKDPKESKLGAGGVEVRIVSNFFKVSRLPKFCGLYQYCVSFDPDIQSMSLKGFLMYSMEDVIGTTRCFDGMTLFLPKKLPDQDTVKSVTLKNGDAVRVKVSFTNQVPENSPAVVQLMNILFRKQLKRLNMQLVGRHYFDPTKKIDIPAHKMQVWPGFETSILQHEKEVMLCANVTHKVLNAQTVLQFLYELYGKVDNRQFYDIAAKKLVGQIVLTRYNNKTYRIDDIDWNKHPTDTFDQRDGSKVTFKEYLKSAYGQAPQDDKQPMLVSRPKDKDRKRGMSGPILLVPEFCSITGLSDEMRSNFTVMKDLAQHTRVGPAGRVDQLKAFMGSLNSNQESQKELSGWNMQFSNSLLEMTGRTLHPQPMFQNKDRFTYDPKSADWSKETRGKELISAISLNNWCLLYTQRDEKIAGDFFQTLQRVAPPMGMRVNMPTRVKLPSDQARAYTEALKANIKRETEIVVCIVPNNRKDRYDSIKKLTCVENPVPSQVVVSRTLSKQQMLMSVCTKIAIQLNCKLGGEIWATEIPVKKLMVVGFDVYHDSLNKGQSIGGFVASTNQNLTRYYSKITKQRSHSEISEQLKVCMTGALKKFREVNGFDPDRVIVYRDGIGDGQLADCEQTEVAQLKQAINEFNKDITKFAMIIVKKRVATRLFAKLPNGYANPMPGTIVDTEVTRPHYYDFFLVSQSVRQGTVTPVHYNIINNSAGLKAEHFQKLTYKLCHLYYNWPGTIKVPAPCQYAHKLAFLVGQSIHTDPSPQLDDRLYYL